MPRYTKLDKAKYILKKVQEYLGGDITVSGNKNARLEVDRYFVYRKGHNKMVVAYYRKNGQEVCTYKQWSDVVRFLHYEKEVPLLPGMILNGKKKYKTMKPGVKKFGYAYQDWGAVYFALDIDQLRKRKRIY